MRMECERVLLPIQRVFGLALARVMFISKTLQHDIPSLGHNSNVDAIIITMTSSAHFLQ
jgi:hypothetical protein